MHLLYCWLRTFALILCLHFARPGIDLWLLAGTGAHPYTDFWEERQRALFYLEKVFVCSFGLDFAISWMRAVRDAPFRAYIICLVR
jgi:hypothetical protein